MDLTALKVTSVENSLKLLAGANAPLFTVIDKEQALDTTGIKFLGSRVQGTQLNGDKYEITLEDKDAALTRLLHNLEQALFFGDSSKDPNSVDGLLTLCSPSNIFNDRELFNQSLAPNMKVVISPEVGWMTEGDLPTSGIRIGIGPGAAVWKQLLPTCKIDLVPFDTKGNTAISLTDPSKPITTPYVERAVICAYGTLVLKDPSQLIVYVPK